MTDPRSVHPEPGRLHRADAAAAEALPCVLTDATRQMLEPWRSQLSGARSTEFDAALSSIADATRRLATLSVELLPDDTEALIAVLTVRCWALGVESTCVRLGGNSPSHDDQVAHDELVARVRAQLEQRFLDQPAAACGDGWDVLAGSLLA